MSKKKPVKAKSKRMRTVFARISEENNVTLDNEELGIKAGDVFRYTIDDITSMIDKWLLTKKFKYYIIEHSGEDGENKHWHLVIEFPPNSSCEFKTLKRKIPYGHIDSCRTGVKNCVRYLVHADNPEKKPYEWTDIITNAPDKLEIYKIPGKTRLDVETKVIIDKIIAGEIKPYQIEKIPSEIYTKKFSQIIKAFDYREKILLVDPTRNVAIIVLQGKTRLGKSTFCKVWAEKHDKSICFSSSGHDYFGEYVGQDIYVFDDFSPDNIKINDFKKAIDPRFNAPVHSRYKNKLFIGDTIFIVTNKPITSWFPYDDDVDRDAVFERIKYVLNFKSYEELVDSSDLSLADDSEIPKFTEGVSYYTLNKLVPTDTYKDIYNKFGKIVNTYREWEIQPVEKSIREFDLKKYIDITADKVADDDFREKLDMI